MEEQWVEKMNSLQALGYFRMFNKNQIADACKLCVLRQFEALDIIYLEKNHHISNVYFVISGECTILQRLEILVAKRNGSDIFDLLPLPSEDASGTLHEGPSASLDEELTGEHYDSNDYSNDAEKQGKENFSAECQNVSDTKTLELLRNIGLPKK